MEAVCSTAYRVCRARQQNLADADVLWSEDLPQLADPRHLDELSDQIALHSIRVLISDSAYLCLLSRD
ncbi:hypothetical protein GC176_10110 [bacterium]|nr:hypothetical protein [bacterium]